jgi:hypothetical protein
MSSKLKIKNRKLELFFDTVHKMSDEYDKETKNKKENKKEIINKKWITRIEGLLYCQLAKGLKKNKPEKHSGGDSNDIEIVCGICYGNETPLIDLHRQGEIHHYFHAECLDTYYTRQTYNQDSINVSNNNQIYCISCSTYIDNNNEYNRPIRGEILLQNVNGEDRVQDFQAMEQFNLETNLREIIHELQRRSQELNDNIHPREILQININQDTLQNIYNMFIYFRNMFIHFRFSNAFNYFHPLYVSENHEFIPILESGYETMLDVLRNTYNRERVVNRLQNEGSLAIINRQRQRYRVHLASISDIGHENVRENIEQGLLPNLEIINSNPILQRLHTELEVREDRVRMIRGTIHNIHGDITPIRENLLVDYFFNIFLAFGFLLIILNPIIQTQHRGGKSKRNRKRKQKRRTQKIHKR